VVQVVDLSLVAGIQQALALLGFDPGVINGIDGPHTQAAVSAFQSQVLRFDMPTGFVDDETRTSLATALRNDDRLPRARGSAQSSSR
jgi:peptidoglycan hydrolase-like protein with peptidoglycan-binding domain